MSNSKNNNKKTSEKAKLMSKWQKMPYTNRELSWVDFNARVLEEALQKDQPNYRKDATSFQLRHQTLT